MRYVTPNPKKGTQERIGPEEAVGKTKHPEVLTAVSEFGETFTPVFSRQNLPLVAKEAQEFRE
jgi:hypothetical protein